MRTMGAARIRQYYTGACLTGTQPQWQAMEEQRMLHRSLTASSAITPQVFRVAAPTREHSRIAQLSPIAPAPVVGLMERHYSARTSIPIMLGMEVVRTVHLSTIVYW